MTIDEQIERLRKEYAEATHPTHDTLSTEPRYECAYCTEVELAPNCHHEDCIALVFSETADTIERLAKALVEIEARAETESIADRNSAFEWIRQIAQQALTGDDE